LAKIFLDTRSGVGVGFMGSNLAILLDQISGFFDWFQLLLVVQGLVVFPVPVGPNSKDKAKLVRIFGALKNVRNDHVGVFRDTRNIRVSHHSLFHFYRSLCTLTLHLAFYFNITLSLSTTIPLPKFSPSFNIHFLFSLPRNGHFKMTDPPFNVSKSWEK
jgi:hypothetical protein